MLRIPWTEKKSNAEVLSTAGMGGYMMATIRKR